VLASTKVPSLDRKDAPNTPRSGSSGHTEGLMKGPTPRCHSNSSDLAGSSGQIRQRGALKQVLILNWRGIFHTTVLMVFTNTVHPLCFLP